LELLCSLRRDPSSTSGKLLGIVISHDLYRGGDMGYCLVVTREEVVGARKPADMEHFEAYLGPGSEAGSSVQIEAQTLAARVAANKEFLVSTGSIGQVLIKRPSMLSGGYVIIKTGVDSIRVDTTVVSTNSPMLLETSRKLEESLAMAVGERLRDSGAFPWSRPRGSPALQPLG
jgi:hypothetical protein